MITPLPVNFQSITSALPNLTKKELEDIRRRCVILLQSKQSTRQNIEEDDWLLYGVGQELKYRGLEDGERFAAFRIKNASSYSGYLEKARAVRTLLEECAPNITTVERRYLGEIAAKELARYIDTWKNTDVSRDSLLHHIDKIPVALQRSFPNYLESKLLGMLIK